MKKRILGFAMAVAMVSSIFTGCGKPDSTSTVTGNPENGSNAGEDKNNGEITANDLSGTITVAIYSTIDEWAYDELDLTGRFKALYPNADLEIETYKDDSAYWEAMQIRASAGELPDIMFQKPFTISQYAEYLYDISEFADDCSMADAYKYNDQILAIPTMSSGEYIYYWEDMFEAAGVEVPVTWDEFIDVATKVQQYYEKDNANFIAIALGGKDEWTTYPYVEYMSCLENGNGHNWNTMATQDNPFNQDSDIYKAYSKIYRLFTSGAYGRDPLGVGFDQAASLFGQKHAAMIATSSSNFKTVTASADNTDTLKTFYLPTRVNETDPFRVIVQGDNMISITKNSKNQELAKAFVEFYLSDAWYPEFAQLKNVNSTLDSVTIELNPSLNTAKEYQPDAEYVVYDGGNDDYTAISSEIKFNYKKLGCEMFIEGFDFDRRMEELNASWKAAREKFGIQ